MHTVVSLAYGPTGRDLLLKELPEAEGRAFQKLSKLWPTDVKADDKAAVLPWSAPALLHISHPESSFMAALAAFRTRTLVAMIDHDLSVPHSSASITRYACHTSPVSLWLCLVSSTHCQAVYSGCTAPSATRLVPRGAEWKVHAWSGFDSAGATTAAIKSHANKLLGWHDQPLVHDEPPAARVVAPSAGGGGGAGGGAGAGASVSDGDVGSGHGRPVVASNGAAAAHRTRPAAPPPSKLWSELEVDSRGEVAYPKALLEWLQVV